MPYRRLPNTDAARIRALKAALKKGQYLEIDTIAYPFALKQKIEFFLPKFEVAITNSKLAKEKQFDNSQKFSEYTKKEHFYKLYQSCDKQNEYDCLQIFKSQRNQDEFIDQSRKE